MPYREFQDPEGLVWNVWDVVPTLMDGLFETDGGEARALRARATQPRAQQGPVEQSLSHGWLCFQHGEQKRRLAPIPDDWHNLPVQSLQTLLSAAAHVAAHRATEHRKPEYQGPAAGGPSESTL